MKVLCVVLCCMAATMARPQLIRSWPATFAAAPVWPQSHTTPVVMARHGFWPFTTQAAAAVPVVVRYPSQDTSRGLPQPVEDTPEVRAAKTAFAAEYEKAAVAAALSSSAEDIAEGSTLVLIPGTDSKMVPTMAVLKESKSDMTGDMPVEEVKDSQIRRRREAKEPVMMAEKRMMLITPASTHRMGMSLDVSNLMVPHHSVIPMPVPLESMSPVPLVAYPGKAAVTPESAIIVPHTRPFVYPAGPVVPPVVILKEKENVQ